MLQIARVLSANQQQFNAKRAKIAAVCETEVTSHGWHRDARKVTNSRLDDIGTGTGAGLNSGLSTRCPG